MNILEFAESIEMPLFPVQKVILKALYGLELSTEKTLEISDHTRRHVRTMSESDYLKLLHDEGRCNIAEVGRPKTNLILSAGRRSGKSLLSNLVVSYEVSRILKMDCPQDRYGLPSGQGISCTMVSTDVCQSQFSLKGALSYLDLTREGMLHNVSRTVQQAEYQTWNDMKTTGVRHRNPNSHASVILRSKTQYSQSFRGLSSFLVLFDEIAHYDKSKVESLYNTVVPSTSAFCPKDSADKRKSVGPVESKVMMISTPTPCRDSFFYRIFQMGMIFSLRHPDSGDLCLQIPTWEMNPTLPAEVFAQDRAKDHSRFDYEYGAQFPK